LKEFILARSDSLRTIVLVCVWWRVWSQLCADRQR